MLFIPKMAEAAFKNVTWSVTTTFKVVFRFRDKRISNATASEYLQIDVALSGLFAIKLFYIINYVEIKLMLFANHNKLNNLKR